MEAPVETVSKSTEVTGSVFGEIERMISATQTGFEVSQNRVDPVELRQVLGLATVRDDWPVLAASISSPAKQLIPSEVTIQPGARSALAQSKTALRVKPESTRLPDEPITQDSRFKDCKLKECPATQAIR